MRTRSVTSASEATDRGAMTPGIEIVSVSKTFLDDHGQRVAAVDDVDISVEEGEFLVLLGPSGCGKTTLLRCLAGLETPDSGEVRIKGRTVFSGSTKVDGSQRRVGMVFQSYALWPHMTVEQNVAYPLQSAPRKQRLPKEKIRARVAELLTLMRLETQAQRKPGQLSGGQQQRVALARAIAAGNDVVLFDEPLSNIDAKVRESLRLELRNMQRKLGFTAVYVTHDQTEALELADRIAVMRDGKVVQLGSPAEVYREPASHFVADFVGTSNLLPATVSAEQGSALPAYDTPLGVMQASTVRHGADETGLTVSSRAHSWWIRVVEPTASPNSWKGRVVSTAYLGWYTEFVVQVGDTLVRVWEDHAGSARDVEERAEVWIGVSPENCAVVSHDG